MKRTEILCGLCVMAALGTLGSVAARAQQSNRKVTFDVVVEAKGSKAAPVSGLQASDFSVLDNKMPRAVTSFRAFHGSEEPVRVVLLVDAVNIRADGLAYERNQIVSFLKANGGKLAHPAKIAILTDNGMQTQAAYTTDGNVLAASLQKQNIGLREIRRSNGFYGAADEYSISINGLETLAAHEAQQPGRTVILWISPGWPLLSGPGVQLTDKDERQIFANIVRLSTMLREERVTLYAIDPIGANESVERTYLYEQYVRGISRYSQTDVGDLSLQVLALQSGGLALNSNDTTGLLRRCYADLDAYYEISFDAPPTEKPDAYHHVEVVVDKPGLVARTRDGYYAQP